MGCGDVGGLVVAGDGIDAVKDVHHFVGRRGRVFQLGDGFSGGADQGRTDDDGRVVEVHGHQFEGSHGLKDGGFYAVCAVCKTLLPMSPGSR